MASMHTHSGLKYLRGDCISVNVEDIFEHVISVKFVNEQKIYRGILLEDCSGVHNEYGINPERVLSAQSWSPASMNGSSLNLKTISCSTERYTQKVDGQASNLNVFQPDPSKRGHRHQPAPQLSRILRPRRFICRKCKKAYHLEEHETELSSLVDQSDKKSTDNYDSDSVNTSYSCTRSEAALESGQMSGITSQSIRRVTPSIIPKLNKELVVNSTDLPENTIVETERVKLMKKDSHDNNEQVVNKVESKPIQKKRKSDSTTSDLQKPKKVKVSSNRQQIAVATNLSSTTNLLENSCNSISRIGLVNDDDDDDDVNKEDTSKSLNNQSQTSSTNQPNNQSQPQRNRIKAQYVSVFLPVKKSVNMKSIDRSLNSSANQIARKQTSKTTHIGKKSLSTNLRYRTRKNTVSENSQSNTCDTVPKTPQTSKSINTDDSQETETPEQESSTDSKSCGLLSSSTKEKQSAFNKSSSSTSSQISSTDVSQSSVGRRKSFDYEKPKNRWIREARAKRNQDERSLQPSSNSSNPLCKSEIYSDNLSNAPSPSSRLRNRPTDPLSNINPESSIKSPCYTSQTKTKPINSEEPIDSRGLCSSNPPSCPNADGLTVPVLKIKINRSRNSSGCSVTKPTQYEVINLTGVENESSQQADDPFYERCSETKSSVCNGAYTPSLSPSTSSSRKDNNNNNNNNNGIPNDSVKYGATVDNCKLSNGTIFHVGDLVWSKLSGWPYWPAQITNIQTTYEFEGEQDTQAVLTSDSKLKSYTACLHWFSWHQVSYVSCDKLFHFLEHYDRFDNKKKRGTFRQAVNEAQQVAKDRKSSFHTDGDADVKHIDLVMDKSDELSDKQNFSGLPETSSTSENPIDASFESVSVVTPSYALKTTKHSHKHHHSIKDDDPTTTSDINNDTKRKKKKKKKKDDVSQIINDDDTSQIKCDQTMMMMVTKNNSETPCFSDSSNSQMISVDSSQPYCNINESGAQMIGSDGVTSIDQLHEQTRSNSSGRLKIVLSASKSNTKLKRKTKKINNSANRALFSQHEDRNSSLPMEPAVVPTTVGLDRLNVTVNGNNNDNSNASPINRDPLENRALSDYHNRSNDLLNQFPHVFPDLNISGILSDTVDIPTFSEDESEEDVGRLIIDPDVMASVNAPLTQNASFSHHDIKIGHQSGLIHGNLFNVQHSEFGSSSSSINNNNNNNSSGNFPFPPNPHSFPHILPSGSTFNMDSASAFISSISSLPISSKVTDCCASSCNLHAVHPVTDSMVQSNLSTQKINNQSCLTNASIPNNHFQSNHPQTSAHTMPYIATEYTNL